MSKLSCLLLLVGCFACHSSNPGHSVPSSETIAHSEILQTIAFGSCNKHNNDQLIWSPIIENKPDLWIWLGDIVYADTKDMAKMAKMYHIQKAHPEYQALCQSVPVIGTWDDHDYGVNDGDRTYPKRSESRDNLMNFLDVPENDPMRKRKLGAYSVHTYGTGQQKVKIVLLDARTFRDPLVKNPGSGQRYKSNPEGDILGEEQWKWLENELKNSDAQIHLIGCGIQIIPEEHAFEKWANFPKARKRFFDLLQHTKAKRPILISGDRHIAELSKYDQQGFQEPVYELTSSGLTHSYENAKDESNRHRIGQLVNQRNFGLIHIDWKGDVPALKVEVRGLQNRLYLEEVLKY